MTSRRRRQDVRAYAAQQGISYTSALRIFEQHEASTRGRDVTPLLDVEGGEKVVFSNVPTSGQLFDLNEPESLRRIADSTSIEQSEDCGAHLAGLLNTPTVIGGGCYFQPLRRFENDGAAVFVGPSFIVDPFVKSLREQAESGRFKELAQVPVDVYRLADYPRYSSIEEHVVAAVRMSRSQGRVVFVVDDSRQMRESREHTVLAGFIPDGLVQIIRDVRECPSFLSAKHDVVSFERGPIYLFDERVEGSPRGASLGVLDKRGFLGSAKRQTVDVISDPEVARAHLAREDQLIAPTVYLAEADDDGGVASLVAAEGERVNMALLCTSRALASQVRRAGTIITISPDGECSIKVGTP